MIESPLEQPTSPAQTGKDEHRIFCQQDLWYFLTDAGDTVGPFRYRSEAQSGLLHFHAQQERSD